MASHSDTDATASTCGWRYTGYTLRNELVRVELGGEGLTDSDELIRNQSEAIEKVASHDAQSSSQPQPITPSRCRGLIREMSETFAVVPDNSTGTLTARIAASVRRRC